MKKLLLPITLAVLSAVPVYAQAQVDIAKLPHADELYEIYEKDPLIPSLDSVIMGYRRKIDLLDHVQNSVSG